MLFIVKKGIFLLYFIIGFGVCFVQNAIAQEPVSWSLANFTRSAPIELPPINLDHIAVEDSINDLDKSMPWRYGIARSLSVNSSNSGIWTTLENGDRIWQVAIKSPEALNMSVNFSNFNLPVGARLQIYNGDRTEISKTYSSGNNRENNALGSWFVTGDEIWIEYFEPSSVYGNVYLEIGEVIHGYRMGKVNQLVDNMRGLNDSGDCNYDVNCSIGEDFESKKQMVKKAVALLNIGNGYLCSAVLINNALNDKTPYVLTANHCLEIGDPAFWSLRFNWMSPAPICGTGEDTVDIQTNFTMSGAEVRASNSQSDFALVELHNKIPNSWDVSFAGWDNSDTLPLYEVGIHHPNGDIMKICRDDSGAVHENANGTDVWLIGGTSVGSGNGWEIGTTESGSSGSPLFNENGCIIGQLYAGQSFCDGVENNNDYDIYGRFGVSWNAGNTPQSRLKEWLDPLNSGQTSIEGIQNILSIPDNQTVGILKIYPNPASSVVTVENTRYPDLSFQLYSHTGQVVKNGSLSDSMNSIIVQDLSKGIYLLHIKDNLSSDQITKKIIIE